MARMEGELSDQPAGIPTIAEPNTRVAIQWTNGHLPGSFTIGTSQPLHVNAGPNSNPFWSASVTSLTFNGSFSSAGTLYLLGIPVAGSGVVDNRLNNDVSLIIRVADFADALASHPIPCESFLP